MGKSTTRPHEIHLRLSEEEYQALETNRKKSSATENQPNAVCDPGTQDRKGQPLCADD